MKNILICLFLAIACVAIDFNVEIQGGQKFCFYEVFDTNQKYSFVVLPHHGNQMQVEVTMIEGKQWKQVYFINTVEEPKRVVQLHKLASAATTYSFCTTNLDRSMGVFNMTSNMGLEVMELNELPDLNDAQNLERQLNWLSSQNEALRERANNLVGLRTTNQQIASMIGKKMIVFAIIGMLVILGVNFVFYKSLKKTFKDRKLI